MVIDVERVGVCGTDVEFFTGEMAYLHQGFAEFPMRIGHEWCGTVSAVGEGVDPSWVGRRTTGDTMLGCGHCRRCRTGLQHVCADRFEIGIKGGFPGALAEQLAVPVSALHPLPDSVDVVAGAMVEPGGNALRSVWGAQPGRRRPGAGARSRHHRSAVRHVRARRRRRGSPDGQDRALPGVRPDVGVSRCLVDGRSARTALGRGDRLRPTHRICLPLALDLVEPGKRVVYVGLAGRPSLLDTRTIALKDVTAVGILSASPGLAGAIEQYASGAVDPRPLVAATVGLDEVGAVLGGWRPPDAGAGPKIHIDPRVT